MKICTGRELNPDLPRGGEARILPLNHQCYRLVSKQFTSAKIWKQEQVHKVHVVQNGVFKKPLPESLEASEQWTKHTNVLYRPGRLSLSRLYISM